MVWRCCKLIIRFLEGREQIRKFVRSCFRWPWICCYNCASEWRLSLRLGIHFNKSLINIFQLVWLLYDDPERSYDRLKLTSIFIKLGVTQVLTYPWSFLPSQIESASWTKENGRAWGNFKNHLTNPLVCRNCCHAKVKWTSTYLCWLDQVKWIRVQRERYQLPSVEETLSKLSSARVFTKLDANSGFWQIPLHSDSQLLTTFLTPFGRYCFTASPFALPQLQNTSSIALQLFWMDSME